MAEVQKKKKEEQDEAGARLGRPSEASLKVWASVTRATEAINRF